MSRTWFDMLSAARELPSATVMMRAVLVCLCAASPLPASGQPERWTLERTVTIGDALDPETGLTLVGGVIVRGDRLFLAQPFEKRLRVYSLAGDFLGFVGRDGEGPGEFRSVDGMGLLDGRVWVHDYDLARLQYFDAEGRLVSSVLVRGHPSLRQDGAMIRGILAGGSRLVRYSASANEEVQSPTMPRALLLFDPEGRPPDTVAMMVGRSSVVQLTDGRETGWARYAFLPESYRSLLSVAPDGSGFVVVHRTGATSAEPHTFRVIRFDARADTAWTREVPYDPIRVPGAWRSRHVDEEVRETRDPRRWRRPHSAGVGEGLRQVGVLPARRRCGGRRGRHDMAAHPHGRGFVRVGSAGRIRSFPCSRRCPAARQGQVGGRGIAVVRRA